MIRCLRDLSVACAVLAVALSVGVEGRHHTGTVRIGIREGDPQWHFVGKFGYAIGSGVYDLRLRLPNPAGALSVNLEVYLDEDWSKVEGLAPCERAFGVPARKTHVLRATEEWGPWMGGLLEQRIRPHIWYFALSKCTGHAVNSTFELEYELLHRQHDGSELSVEHRYMPLATGISLLISTGFLLRFAGLCHGFWQKCGAVHPVIQTLGVSVLLQWFSQILHLAHLVHFESDGIGHPNVDASSDIIFMLSQVVTCTLLLLIAQGYTLYEAKETEWRAIKPLAACVATLHVAFVGHGKLQGEHSEKHHENEGVCGWAILFVRIVLYMWFVFGIGGMMRRSGLRLHNFLRTFHLAGSLYFLSYPAIFLITQVFAPYLRHPVMQIGLVVAQTCSAFWLSDLFLRRGAYYEVSTFSCSFLPGANSPASSPVCCKSE